MPKTQDAKKVQWIKGDKLGKVETILNEGTEWIDFESGSRINASLLNEFMIDVTDEGALLDSEINLDPSRNKEPQKNNTRKEDQGLGNPIMTLFKSMENAHNHNLSIPISVNIPKKDLYNILSGSFGEDRVKDTLKKYINDQLDTKKLRSAVNESIKDLINSLTYYDD